MQLCFMSDVGFKIMAVTGHSMGVILVTLKKIYAFSSLL
jgi:hypothetical protein